MVNGERSGLGRTNASRGLTVHRSRLTVHALVWCFTALLSSAERGPYLRPMTSPQDDQGARLEALERQVASLSAEVAELRATRESQPVPPAASRAGAPGGDNPDIARIQSAAERLYRRASGD